MGGGAAEGPGGPGGWVGEEAGERGCVWRGGYALGFGRLGFWRREVWVWTGVWIFLRLVVPVGGVLVAVGSLLSGLTGIS